TVLRAAGVRRQDAGRFALLMSLPVTAGAAGLTLLRAERPLLRALAPLLGAGVPAAAVAAAWAVSRAAETALRPVAAYRLGFAAAVAVRERSAAGREGRT
ncbi:MAG: hypothetical protein M3P93_10360, partial [Actinomycetota bacterium]|nr:hypothetical protein [Actinomycetota bacterium]